MERKRECNGVWGWKSRRWQSRREYRRKNLNRKTRRTSSTSQAQVVLSTDAPITASITSITSRTSITPLISIILTVVTTNNHFAISYRKRDSINCKGHLERLPNYRKNGPPEGNIIIQIIMYEVL